MRMCSSVAHAVGAPRSRPTCARRRRRSRTSLISAVREIAGFAPSINCRFSDVHRGDDRNGHVRFDERSGEPERWTSRRERQRKTPLVLGAAGPVRHRAPLRLYTARKTQPFSMHPPPAVKTAEQQAIQTLHRVRTQWQATRTARINVMRGVLRELPVRRVCRVFVHALGRFAPMLGVLLLRDADLQRAPTVFTQNDDAESRVRAPVLLALRQRPNCPTGWAWVPADRCDTSASTARESPHRLVLVR